jgi:hypothetical protein
LLPGRIFVPPPHHKVLEGLRRRDRPDHDSPEREPRYVVSVSWGVNYLPWITGIRLFPGTARDPKAP